MKQRTQRNAKLIRFNLHNKLAWRGKYLRLARQRITANDAKRGYTPVDYLTMSHDRVDLVHGDGYLQYATTQTIL